MSLPVEVYMAGRLLGEATIADAASLSAAIDLGAKTLAAVAIPAAWVAATLSFQVSPDGVTWYDLHDSNGEINMTIAAGQVIALDPATFWGIRHVKLRSGTSAAPVSQTGGPLTIPLMLVP